MSVKDNPNFRQINNTNYYVSIFGDIYRVCKTKDRKLHPYYKKDKGKMLIKINGKEEIFAKLVWEAFKGKVPDGYSVVHKLGKKDNALSNLKLMSRKELGTNYGKHTTRTKYYYCEETKRVYKGTRECAKALHISRQTVSDYANRIVKKPMYTIRILKQKPYESN